MRYAYNDDVKTTRGEEEEEAQEQIEEGGEIPVSLDTVCTTGPFYLMCLVFWCVLCHSCEGVAWAFFLSRRVPCVCVWAAARCMVVNFFAVRYHNHTGLGLEILQN